MQCLFKYLSKRDLKLLLRCFGDFFGHISGNYLSQIKTFSFENLLSFAANYTVSKYRINYNVSLKISIENPVQSHIIIYFKTAVEVL